MRGHDEGKPLAAAFSAGTTLGGLLTGAGLAVLGGLLSVLPVDLRLITAVVIVLALVVTDLLSATLPLPQRDTLIPQEVFARGMGSGLFRFGVEYGLGWRVLVPSAAPWILATTLVLLNLPWWQTVLAGALFGLGRSVAIWQMLFFADDGWQEPLVRHSRTFEQLGSLVTAALVVAVVLAQLT